VQSKRGGTGGGRTTLTERGREILSAYEEGNSSIQTFLEGGPRHPRVAVDGILVTRGKLVAIRRKYPPFKGKLALPGGFVEYGEKVEDAVLREFEEETGLKTSVQRMLGVYSAPDRDPRGQVISVVFILKRDRGKLRSGSDAESVELVDPERVEGMAFDHAGIIEDYLSLTD
jgi:8-oxo-dGTP diphosphatase